ncbi:MAG: diguanylate cyclase [Candidatus Acidiferrales bacterium]
MTEERPKSNRILIADDDPVARAMLQAFLRKWEYDVVAVSDGLAAADVLDDIEAPQLAILDWMMPGLEGPEICRRVRAHSDRPYVYILLVTSRAHRGDFFEGLESGADDYLTKPFDSDELRARLLVAQRILGLQAKLIAAREELRFKATHDALTGIANRAAAIEAIHRERSRQIRESGSFGVMLIDVDHFKRVNDGYGHLVGDLVLKEVARRIAASLRPYDTVGRYGGEEFLVVAPLSDAAGTLSLAERIRKCVGSTPIVADPSPIQVSISCGVALCDSRSPIEIEPLLYLADEALYRAKNLGRNRCELAVVDDVLPQPLRSGVDFA